MHTTKFWKENLTEVHWEDLVVAGRTALKWILNKEDREEGGEMWIRTSSGLL
jgi:hypothetical protein